MDGPVDLRKQGVKLLVGALFYRQYPCCLGRCIEPCEEKKEKEEEEAAEVKEEAAELEEAEVVCGV